MSGFKLNIFSGIQPRLPESLLPVPAATVAQNCDFAYGELRNTKGGYLVNSMSNSPQSIYTDDGLTFYTWPGDVNAIRSPIAKDEFQRMYFTDGGTMKVASRISTRPTGGPPGSSYNVGVPRPTVAPKLTAQAIVTPNHETATLVCHFHWEYGGVKYQEQAITPTTLALDKYQFTPPAMTPATPTTPGAVAGTTPAQAFPVLRMAVTWKKDSSQVFDIYSDNSSLASKSGVYTLSMVKDTAGDTYTATVSASIKEADKEARAYVYTYVNTYGEEGPPSEATIVTTSLLAGVDYTVTLDAAPGYAPIKEIRGYRTPSGSNIAEFFFVGAIPTLGTPPGELSGTDDVPAAGLNEPLSSTNYYPPEVGLGGLIVLPNGILCAGKGNELWFSEAYKPHAWPPAYVKVLPHTLVGGIAHGSGAVVTTVQHPYLISGVSPDSMTASRLNVDQAGVSKHAMAVVDGACMYASNDGLVVLNGGQASLTQSGKFFTREVWRARYAAGLASMRFAVWDGRLVVFSGTGAFTPFMIRVDEADGTMTDLPNLSAACAFVSPLSDQFYYGSGNGLYQFNGGTDQTAVWQSREMVLSKPVNFGSFQAVCTGAWSIEFYADGVLKHSQALPAGKGTYRLPSGYKSDRWKIKLTGTGRFRELRVAQTGRELAAL